MLFSSQCLTTWRRREGKERREAYIFSARTGRKKKKGQGEGVLLFFRVITKRRKAPQEAEKGKKVQLSSHRREKKRKRAKGKSFTHERKKGEDARLSLVAKGKNASMGGEEKKKKREVYVFES